MIIAVGNGKPTSSNGWDAAAGTQVGMGLKSGVRVCLGSY